MTRRGRRHVEQTFRKAPIDGVDRAADPEVGYSNPERITSPKGRVVG
jgi:hypothetical protein